MVNIYIYIYIYKKNIIFHANAQNKLAIYHLLDCVMNLTNIINFVGLKDKKRLKEIEMND